MRLRTNVSHLAAFAGDFFSPTPRLTLSGSMRLTHSAIELRDQIGTDLNGDHRFTALNAAGGATVDVLPGAVTLFGGLSRSTRVPTPSELSCADPDDPCRLPNAFLSDPPLDMVVAHTWEGGARGRWRTASWAAALFNTRNRDDIIFVSSGPLTNHGHFANVGTTNRAGVELTAAGSSAPHAVARRLHLPAGDVRLTARARQRQPSRRRGRRDPGGGGRLAAERPPAPRQGRRAGAGGAARPGGQRLAPVVAVPAGRRGESAGADRAGDHGELHGRLPAGRA